MRAKRDSDLISGTAARAHVRHLMATYHATGTTIAQAAGLAPTTVNWIMAHEESQVSRGVARKILALKTAPPGQLVPGLAVRRMLKALQAEGYTAEIMAAALGLNVSYLTHMLHDEYERIRATTDQAVRLYYEQHRGTPGPSSALRAKHRNRGDATSAEWDGIDMDDPAATPRPVRR